MNLVRLLLAAQVDGNVVGRDAEILEAAGLACMKNTRLLVSPRGTLLLDSILLACRKTIRTPFPKEDIETLRNAVLVLRRLGTISEERLDMDAEDGEEGPGYQALSIVERLTSPRGDDVLTELADLLDQANREEGGL